MSNKTKTIPNTEAVKVISMGKKTREDFLYMLRKCQKIETLETVIHHKELHLPEEDLMNFYGAADHRRAEIIMGKLFDKVPASVWKYVY